MTTSVKKRIGPLPGLFLFALAAVVLHRQLKVYGLHDILAGVHGMPPGRIWSAVLLTVCSYLVMTGYDLLALRYIRHPIAPAKTALVSFIGYAFSNNVGFSMIAGASVRYRLYSAWGLSAVEITQVVLFCTTSLWLGFFVLSGAAFVTEPLGLPASLHWPVGTVRPIGVILLAMAAFYFTATIVGKKALAYKEWWFSLPSWRLSGAQLTIASADWLLAGAVLFALWPSNVPLAFGHFLEISHFLGSLAGMGLLLLSRGLQRRLDAAYLLTTGLLGFGIAASLLSESFSPGWLAAIAVVLTASIWLGLFAFHHVEYRQELWWHFSAKAEAPRFLRAAVGALALALGFGLARLLRPAAYRPTKSENDLLEAVPAIVARSPVAAANLALLGDKHFLIGENRQAFIMYGVTGQTWVAMGDPVGPAEQWPELLWRFRQAADRYADRAVFYEVGREHLHLYLDMGLALLKLGEEARVPLTDFSMTGSGRKDLRYTRRKLSREGCTFEIVPATSAPMHMVDLKTISDAWLKEKNTREKGFSLGFFDPDYLSRFPIGVVRVGQRITALANLWQSAGRVELSVDLMRHRPDAPGGVMEFLFIELIMWGAAQGFRWFNLGMAPLSGMETREPAPLWHRIGNLVVRFGDHFYNFQGLRAYKQKFDPVWQPRYLATPGEMSLPRTLADIGALVSRGLKGILFK